MVKIENKVKSLVRKCRARMKMNVKVLYFISLHQLLIKIKAVLKSIMKRIHFTHMLQKHLKKFRGKIKFKNGDNYRKIIDIFVVDFAIIAIFSILYLIVS
jgi:hypothetical protein